MATIAEAVKTVEEIELQLKEIGLEYWVKFDSRGYITFTTVSTGVVPHWAIGP